MINRIRRNEILWGFLIIGGLWILGIIFSGEILFIDTISIGPGSTVLSSIFPVAFLVVLVWIACISKRNGLDEFFKTSYILAAIPIVSTLPGFLSNIFVNDTVLFALGTVFSMLFGMPVMSVVGAVAYWYGVAFIILVSSLIISMICYLTLKGNTSDRP
ncbi:MAG: hypothetical protein IJN94_02490 [Clostridia bacterium]|nr:hypothetical protein [Clostridia bacterium]